jgi:hypothetical protein
VTLSKNGQLQSSSLKEASLFREEVGSLGFGSVEWMIGKTGAQIHLIKLFGKSWFSLL